MATVIRKTVFYLFCITLFILIESTVCHAGVSPYGVCAHVSRHSDHQLAEAEFALMKKAGIQWTRTDFDWTTVQPRKDIWDYSMLDATVDKAEAAGITILPILAYDVAWASPAYKHLDDWLEYVRRTVGRYHNRLKYWEVWNEQDLEQFWKETPNPANYTTLLKATYREIKKIDPDIQVLLGGLSGIPYEYIEGIYEAGGGPFFDVMAVHPYRYPEQPESRSLKDDLDKLRQLMARYGDEKKPIWITEIGWPTHRNRTALLEDIVRTGLQTVQPDRKSWTLAVLDNAPSPVPLSNDQLRAMVGGGQVERLTPDKINGLTTERYQALLIGPSESFAAATFDAIEAFVRNGGVVIFTQGVPLYYADRVDDDGNWTRQGADESYRRRLHIGWQAWWTQDGVPKKANTLTAPKPFDSQIQLSGKTPAGERFLTDSAVKPGDRFIPLLQAADGDFTGTVAAVYDLDSDLKGAVIATALFQDYRGVTEAEQAAILPRAYLIALHSGVDCMFWYNFRAGENDPTYNEDNFGILHKDLSPKPAYRTLWVLNRIRPAGSTALEKDWQTGNIFYPGWQRPDGQTAWALWTSGSDRTIPLQAAGQIRDAYDHLGKPVNLKQAADGKPEISLSQTPIYIVGPTDLQPRP